MVKHLLGAVFVTPSPRLRSQTKTDDRERLALVPVASRITHNRTESHPEPEGLEDFVHEHVGPLEVVRSQEVQLGPVSMGVDIGTVVAN